MGESVNKSCQGALFSSNSSGFRLLQPFLFLYTGRMNRRQVAIEAISRMTHSRDSLEQVKPNIQELFGEQAFTRSVAKDRLSSGDFARLEETIDEGKELDPSLADAVALAMRVWAIERGATHFCHWFQPLTELTAEKHDSLFAPGEEGHIIEQFSGKELIRGEPDASSFPSGGLRTTFEARGYTAWDPSSPAFIFDTPGGATLFIPTIFVSYTGEALDKKTPLLRSMEALSKQALRLLRLFGDQETKRVVPTVGAEQEYYLIDTQFYHARPDLVATGRTLFGARPPKGQELEDQYLGAIPERVLAMMTELELELLRLGIPVQTRHNEVGPAQYELALNFESATLACDHGMVVMEMLKRVCGRHGMTVLLHEKPFDGINGSGKHTNWSLATNLGTNLLEPGSTPHDNAQFLLFLTAVVQAIYRHAELLRLSIAVPGNDHRLGLHEAPPAIMSVFLGEQLTSILESLQSGKEHKAPSLGHLEVGVSALPGISLHLSDRNRTSPFAFTGNKFEFRAVGSSQNIATAVTILNTIVAESLDDCATRLEKASDLNQAVGELLSEMIEEFSPILYEGDNYNSVWVKEAKKRGLPHLRNLVDAAFVYQSPKARALFPKYGVYSEAELSSRLEILLETYIKRGVIEAQTSSMIAHTMILPSCCKYLVDLGRAEKYGLKSSTPKKLAKGIGEFERALANLDASLSRLPKEGIEEQARFVRDAIFPSMHAVRLCSDRLEERITDVYWPLPKYWEMLFIR